MKLIATFLAFALASKLSVAAAAPPSRLSFSAQRHVTRVSNSLATLNKDPTDKLANSQANRAFELLIKDTSPAGDEALAALVGHYLGDSTEPECEVLARGDRMLPVLARFIRSPPSIHLPISNTDSRSELSNQIKAGVLCE